VEWLHENVYMGDDMKIEQKCINIDIERVRTISFHNDGTPFIHIIDQNGACHRYDGDDFTWCNIEMDSGDIVIHGHK
jgi:hypothetical protein